MKSNFAKRTITAVAFLVVVLFSIFTKNIVFGSVFFIFNILATVEYYLITENVGFSPQKYYGTFIGAFVFVTVFLYADGYIEPDIFLAIIPLIILLIVSELYRIKEHNFRSIAITILGIVYVSLPFSLLNLILINPISGSEYPNIMIVSFFAIIWMNDTGAYIIGSAIGKNKLFERISPKKTWEGTVGGIVVAIISGFVFSLFFENLNTWQWILYAAVIAIFGTYGDLSESMLKRRANVKDSGNLLPGHGGFLDRFDSTLFAAPMAYSLLKLFEYL